MPALKPYSQWDYWWVVEQTKMQRRRLRYPPQLGVPRSARQGFLSWWRDRAWVRWLIGAAFLVLLFIGTLRLVSNSTSAWVLMAGMACSGVAALVSVWWSGGGVDGRCVAAAHLRARCARHCGPKELAWEIGERRRSWNVLMTDMPQKLRNAILLQSTSWRLVRALYLFVLMSGPLIGPLLNALGASGPSGPTRASARGNMMWAFLQQGTLISCVLVFFAWQHLTWNRMKARLGGAIAGRSCPDCGYQVEQGVVVNTEPHIEIAIGPERCSECGCPWPLIPSALGTDSERWERRH
ncbi:MAG: hypothetical protein KF805_10580 [Phycisphaeraceae bacterium]|nr:hypothetical protein [Phycisphaeraceae bacterium]